MLKDMENSELITKTLWYIRNQKSNTALTIDDIAEHAGFSTDYFNRIFLAHTGFNVMEYLRFCRLKNAAMVLRNSDVNVLDVALQSGYETHESFSRAFKKQYGVSPTEYRQKYINKEVLWGDYHNETVCERMIHEFKNLKPADTDEVIDWLLETDAVKYGYTAVSMIVNGGPVLYVGDDFRDGFVWVTEWSHGIECEVVSNDYSTVSEYLKMFSDDRFCVNIYTIDNDETLTGELGENGIEVSSIERIYQNVYCGDPFDLKSPEGITMRELKYEDAGLIDRFNESRSKKLPMVNGIKNVLYKRNVLGGEDCMEFCFGIFRENEMIGFSIASLQYAHGFTVNNCVYTYFLDDCATDELYVYAFKFVTNWALEKGAMPFDDVQTLHSKENERCGKFNSTDLGYKPSLCVCMLKYRVR